MPAFFVGFNMKLLTDKIERIITPSLADMGYSVVQVRLLGQDGGRKTLQIMAEHSDGRGVTIDDCANISRTISALLDVEDPIKGAYELEVSSPGIDRPLVRQQDFVRFRGHMAKISLSQPDSEGQRRFKGRLGELRDSNLTLELENGEEVIVDISGIEKAKLVLTDKLLKESQREQA